MQVVFVCVPFTLGKGMNSLLPPAMSKIAFLGEEVEL